MSTHLQIKMTVLQPPNGVTQPGVWELFKASMWKQGFFKHAEKETQLKETAIVLSYVWKHIQSRELKLLPLEYYAVLFFSFLFFISLSLL